MVWYIFTAAAVFIIWYYTIRPLNYFTRMGVKQCTPWPIVGNAWPFLLRLKSFSDLLIHNYNKFPDVRYMGHYQFTQPGLILKDPDLIKQITIKDFDHFTDHKNFVEPDVEPLFGHNLFSLKGQSWKEVRSMLTGSFTSSKMKHIFEIINEAAENFAKYYVNKNEELIEVEMKDIFTKYTNDVIATTAFGLKVDTLTEPNNAFYTMGRKLTNLNKFSNAVKFAGFIVIPKLMKTFKIRLFPEDATNFFRNIIQETIKVREENNIKRPDMLNLLIEARKEQKFETTETGFAVANEEGYFDNYKPKKEKQLTDDDIAAQALIFFFGGFETISTVLCFGAYELAVNVDIQDKLRHEILKTNKTNSGKLTYEALMQMKYMDMIVSEMLRKWPPAIFMDRVCTKPYTIESVHPNERPVHLKVGDQVWLPIFALLRDSKYYPEPEKFNPERFSDENKSSINQYTYIPFGVGPRNCIGSRFAILEIKVILYHLLLNFKIVPTKKTVIPLRLAKVMVQTAEDGFWFGLKPVKT